MYIPISGSTASVSSEEPLKLREGLQVLSSVYLSLQGVKGIELDCQILLVHLFCSASICSHKSIEMTL